MEHALSPRRLEPTSDLGKRLIALVEHKGHASLRAAAEASSLSYQQLWDIVANNKDPRVSTLERIVEALGGTMAELYAEPKATKRRKST